MKYGARFVLAVLLLAFPTAPAHAQSGHDLFQQALVSERSDAELTGAIALYQRIADEYAADHQLAARALLRLGGLYETIGSPEAARVYRRILSDYPEQ